jgi:hypothetical protein
MSGTGRRGGWAASNPADFGYPHVSGGQIVVDVTTDR